MKYSNASRQRQTGAWMPGLGADRSRALPVLQVMKARVRADPETAENVASAKMGEPADTASASTPGLGRERKSVHSTEQAAKKLRSVIPLEIQPSTARNADMQPIDGADSESDKPGVRPVREGVSPGVMASPPRSSGKAPSSDSANVKESEARAKPPSYDPVWGF